MQKIEAPVRDTIPDGGKPVEQRNTNELAPGMKDSNALKPFDSDISADDAMRYALLSYSLRSITILTLNNAYTALHWVMGQKSENII